MAGYNYKNLLKLSYQLKLNMQYQNMVKHIHTMALTSFSPLPLSKRKLEATHHTSSQSRLQLVSEPHTLHRPHASLSTLLAHDKWQHLHALNSKKVPQ